MKGVLSRILSRRSGKRRASAPVEATEIAPDQPVVAVGDIHGRADLLRDLVQQIEVRYPGWPVILLGDYVDRGEQSREVLDLAMSLSAREPADGTSPVTCLMGNHERMMLDFLDTPARSGPRWLRNGGLQALASFGVGPLRGGQADAAELEALSDRLAVAMGEAMIAWLRALPLSWNSGNVWVVHAGADPDLPMTEQPAEVLIWGHPMFGKGPRPDGQWVAHGHTIVDTPKAQDGTIALDTGAYATGRLTAAAISPGDVSFLQTSKARSGGQQHSKT